MTNGLNIPLKGAYHSELILFEAFYLKIDVLFKKVNMLTLQLELITKPFLINL